MSFTATNATGTSTATAITITIAAASPVTPPPYNPGYSGGGSTGGGSTTTTTPSNDLTAMAPNTELSANTAKGTEVEAPASIANPTLDAKEIPVNSPIVKSFVDTAAKSGFAFAKVFEMNMFDGSAKVTQVADGLVKIAVPFAGKEGLNYTVLRFGDNGSITAMPALYKDGKITFTTNHFSLFAVAVASTNKNLLADTTIKNTTSTGVPQTSIITLKKLF